MLSNARAADCARPLSGFSHEHSAQASRRQINNQNNPSCFGLEIECGGGTYIRSLVRDLGRELGTCASMTSLVRSKQGPFGLEQAVKQEDWTVENIYQAVEENNQWLEEEKCTSSSLGDTSSTME